MLELLPKQVQLLNSDADVILYGGGRGGAKTFGTQVASALDVVERYTESEIRIQRKDVTGYRVKTTDDNEVIYYKFLIDYPYYNGVIVRRSVPQLRANTLVEGKKIFPLLGGRFDKDEYCWNFPSGAKIYLRPLYDDRTLDFFQGPSFQRFIVEELTQFDQEMIEMAEACCRSAAPIGGGVRIPAKIIYTTNPGGRGHKWVKEKFVDKCPPLPDGEEIYIEEFDLPYQPLKANVPYVNEHGEKFLFIPALVFDNPHLADNDKRYVRNLMNKNRILKDSWLLGKWNSFMGQFFDMWQDYLHVIDEYEFFGADDYNDIAQARRRFDWKANGYRLFLSNDYGVRNPWACGAYAVDNELNVVKFAEIVETGLSINQQAEKTKEFFRDYYDLTMEDFELIIADPKSYWESRDKGDGFYTFAEEYEKHGIWLTKGKNERLTGAGAMIEALRLQENGLPKLRYLSCCEENISAIPSLPADPHNPDDVDSNANDHCYDETRYFLMVVIGVPLSIVKRTERKTWRDNIKENQPETEKPVAPRSYMTA